MRLVVISHHCADLSLGRLAQVAHPAHHFDLSLAVSPDEIGRKMGADGIGREFIAIADRELHVAVSKGADRDEPFAQHHVAAPARQQGIAGRTLQTGIFLGDDQVLEGVLQLGELVVG